MTILFKKLNLKNHPDIVVINSPVSFESELACLNDVTVHKNIEQIGLINFALVFVLSLKELTYVAGEIIAKLHADAIVWFAYPKKTSKKYQCDISRDVGWQVLGDAGFECVRQIAIDDDWSALRFRRVGFIKSMSRHSTRASSVKGKERTQS